jgi:hypothetical protein
MAGRRQKERTHDTLKLEMTYLRQSLGMLYQPVMKWLKLNGVSNRKEMDAFVHQLLYAGLC